jgi:hypothetical protein
VSWDGSERRAVVAEKLGVEVAGLAASVEELTKFVGQVATSEQVIRSGKANRLMIIAMTIAAVLSVMTVSLFILRNQAITRQGVRCIVGQMALQRGSAEVREDLAERLNIDLSRLPRLPDPNPEVVAADCAPFLEDQGGK